MPYGPYINQVRNAEKPKLEEKANWESDSTHERKPSSTSDSGFESTKAVEMKMGPAPPPRKPKGVDIISLRERSRSISPQSHLQSISPQNHLLSPHGTQYGDCASPNLPRSPRSRTPRSRTPALYTDDDNCSVTSDGNPRVRKISKTGPGRAWYHGYMTNFKGDGDNLGVPRKKLSTSSAVDIGASAERHSSQNPQIQHNESPRPQSANELRNVFISNKLDEIQSHEFHESQQPQVVPRRKTNYRNMKRIFNENSLDQISSQNRTSLHESMVNAKPEADEAIPRHSLEDIKGHLSNRQEIEEVHESQKTPKPKRSGPLRGLRDKFAKQSLEDLSKERRSSLHESMIPQEIEVFDRPQQAVDHPEHTELHESQRVNTMRKKKPKNVSKLFQNKI